MTPRLPALSHAYRPQPRSDADTESRKDRRPFIVATLFAAVMLALIAVTWTASTEVLAATSAGIEWARAHDDLTAKAAFSVILAASGAIAFVIAWARTTDPDRPVRVPGGRGTIAVHELGAWLRDGIEERDDVRSADVLVQSQGKGVRVTARIAVTAAARLQDTANGARAAIEQTLATRIGVPLAAQPTIELRYEELRLRPRPLDTRLEANG